MTTLSVRIGEEPRDVELPVSILEDGRQFIYMGHILREGALEHFRGSHEWEPAPPHLDGYVEAGK